MARRRCCSGVAMGAAQVIAAAAIRMRWKPLARRRRFRAFHTVTLTGGVQKDASALREAAGGGAHMAFDMVGQARDPKATLGSAAQPSPRRPAGADGKHDNRSACSLHHD